jgi:hypothetical protein
MLAFEFAALVPLAGAIYGLVSRPRIGGSGPTRRRSSILVRQESLIRSNVPIFHSTHYISVQCLRDAGNNRRVSASDGRCVVT